MSTPEIKVTFAALLAAQTDVHTTAGRINGQLDELRGYLAPMVATWTGQAAEDYQVTQRKWDTSAKDLTDVLTWIGRALGEAHDNYQVTENANSQRWAASHRA